ncbi:MAG: MFS transporter [Bacteroidetes bacterium]|nr:MFS transporter [Bacteroidota bacterium]
MARFSRAVILLGIVSLFMDVASEMLYPVGPIYLTVVLGASMAWLGIIEGIAEAISGLSKGYFGALSDASGRRRPFVTLGYGLSALSKPLPGIFGSVASVLTSRVVDRVGKGIRTAPRDALLAGHSTPETRGAVFGFHRAMDTIGAAIGPCIALMYLAWHPGDYVTIYLIAIIPGILATLATLGIREKRFTPTIRRTGLAELFRFWREASGDYRVVVIWLTLFAVANSSDAFLLLRARGAGFGDTGTIGAYVIYNLIFALAALPAGRLSDRFGRRRILVTGLVIFAAAYVLFAVAAGSIMIWAAFTLYGLFSALTDGVSKAWISDMIPNDQRGRAIGLQTALASIGTLVASTWTGFVWTYAGGMVPLLVTACVALVATAGLATSARRSRVQPGT